MVKQDVQPKLGVLGGSGVYQMENAKIIREHRIRTPFGNPSDGIMEVEIEGQSAFFLPRHGKGHRLLPSEIPYQANIYALKSLGVTHVLAVSAVGIMQKHIKPGDMIIPNQVYDQTKGVRAQTFFGNGVVGHISFADPFCPDFCEHVYVSAKKFSTVHKEGTYVCIEGPRFSSRVESQAYRSLLSPSAIGMTAVPEANLAREAELSYCLLAMGTDYDCWNEDEADVSTAAILEVLHQNSHTAKKIVADVIARMGALTECPMLGSMSNGIVTPRDQIPAHIKDKLSVLYQLD